MNVATDTFHTSHVFIVHSVALIANSYGLKTFTKIDRQMDLHKPTSMMFSRSYFNNYIQGYMHYNLWRALQPLKVYRNSVDDHVHPNHCAVGCQHHLKNARTPKL